MINNSIAIKLLNIHGISTSVNVLDCKIDIEKNEAVVTLQHEFSDYSYKTVFNLDSLSHEVI